MPLLVLFDIDGTLLRAGDPLHAQAMREALHEIVGEPVLLDGIPLAGMLDRQIARLALLRHGLDETTISELLPKIMERTGALYATRLRPGERMGWVLPGVRPLLRQLAASEHVTGVLTGNVELVARAKLTAAGLAEYLPLGAYGDQADERHQLVELARATVRERYGLVIPPEQTILVGDTPRDIAAAQASGVRILAVATGRFGVTELAACQADAVLPDLADTATVLRTLEALADTHLR